MNQHEVAFNFHRKRFGEIFGQPFQIMTVNYSAVDQTPTELYPQKMYKVEVAGPRLVQNPLPNGAYYCVHGDYNAVNEGYVMVPILTDTSTPIVTFISKSPFEEMTAIRTSRICDILNGEEVLYSNCYFEFATTDNYPADSFHRKVFASEKTPENKALMRKRVMRNANFDTEGLLLRELENGVYTYWKIEQVTEVGSLMSLTLTLSKIE